MINEKNAKKYCSEDISKIVNYNQAIADTMQMWHCHHKLEIQGQFRNSIKLLEKCGLYYNVPAQQLIFLTKSEHNRLHHLGKHHSTEARRKMSEAHYGKKLSKEIRQKISEAKLGKHRLEETKQKISKAMSGKQTWNKGKHHSIETKYKMSKSKLGKHHSAESCRKMSEARLGKHIWNNGVICKMSKECPGPEWKRGRL